MRDGKLVSPEGWEASPGDVLSIPLLKAQISAYQAKQRATEALDKQPLPGAIPRLSDSHRQRLG